MLLPKGVSILALVLLAGCALVEGRDYRIDQANRVIYGRLTSPGYSSVVENVCRMRGGTPPVTGYGTWGGIIACYDPNDDVIIVPEGTTFDDWVWKHENKHRHEGAWHH